jgi:serine/threonine protein kinase
MSTNVPEQTNNLQNKLLFRLLFFYFASSTYSIGDWSVRCDPGFIGEMLRPLTILNDTWELKRKIGEGTFCELYLARDIIDEDSSPLVAVKVQSDTIDSSSVMRVRQHFSFPNFFFISSYFLTLFPHLSSLPVGRRSIACPNGCSFYSTVHLCESYISY